MSEWLSALGAALAGGAPAPVSAWLQALPLAVLFGLGWLAWPLLEYTVHGGLSHGWRTPVSALHWDHHLEPRRVFTSPLAWIPIAAALFAAGVPWLGEAGSAAAVAGILAGFARYEYWHWRIHFRWPRTERERRRRVHHLAHHERNARAYYGVSGDFWDRVFGTLPEPGRRAADYAAVAEREPLRGSSNFGALLPPRRPRAGGAPPRPPAPEPR